MDTSFVIEKCKGSRAHMALLLGVEPITTYRWKPALPRKHERYLRAVRPSWAREWDALQRAAPAETPEP